VENYIISNKTIAILKNNLKTIIYDVDNIRIISKNINKILELNCNFYGNDINFIKNQTKKILNIKYKVPLIINNDIILIQINNLRSNECLFLNHNKILDYRKIDKLIEINCINRNFYSKISKNSLEKNLLNVMKLNNILKYKKIANFV